ncbi:MAG: hypothetical protein ACRCTX_14380, partial [Afipia sp.]
HVAVVKVDSNNWSLYIDGVKDGASFSWGNAFASSTYFSIGAQYDGGAATNAITGQIGYVRVTPGVARWTANFTPPTLADLGAIYSNTMTSGVSVGDANTGSGVFPTQLTEYLSVDYGAIGYWFARIVNGLNIAAANDATSHAVGQVVQGLAIAASLASKATFGESLVSSVTLSGASAAKLLANASMAETVKLYVADIHAGNIDDAVQTWVANLATSAHSRYSQYGFNSFAKFGGKHYGCKSDGIYELGGETDGANPIPWTVTLGETDFGASNLKRFESVYLGVKSTGQLVLKVIGDNGTAYHYNVIPSGNDSRAARAVLGRGLAGRYWKLELASDTERAELDSIDFSFAAMSRRV